MDIAREEKTQFGFSSDKRKPNIDVLDVHIPFAIEYTQAEDYCSNCCWLGWKHTGVAYIIMPVDALKLTSVSVVSSHALQLLSSVDKRLIQHY